MNFFVGDLGADRCLDRCDRFPGTAREDGAVGPQVARLHATGDGTSANPPEPWEAGAFRCGTTTREPSTP